LLTTTDGSFAQTCCPGAVSAGGAVKHNAKCHGDMFDRVAAAA
jgi:hypothetical protein